MRERQRALEAYRWRPRNCSATVFAVSEPCVERPRRAAICYAIFVGEMMKRSKGFLARSVLAAMLATGGLALVEASPAAASNDCGLPTFATPGDAFHASYSSCRECRELAFAMSRNSIFEFKIRKYYCTYNPQNDLSDLHSYG